MQIEEAIKTRRSVRKLSRGNLSRKIIEKIIDAGQHAPSHCNTQGWKFIFIDDEKIKNEIFENGGSYVIKDAPYGILTVYNHSLSDNIEYSDYIQSGAAAIENMLLTIHDLGMGGCWICHLPKKKTLIKILKIKKPYTPIAYIAFGFTGVIPNKIERKNGIKEIYATNQFPWPEEKNGFKLHIRRIMRKTYFALPVSVKKIISPIVDKFVKKFEN
jgi:nitroreductase